MKTKVIGIDLAKASFAVCGMSEFGKVLFTKTLNRKGLMEFLIKHPITLVAFEACGGSHYWARFCSRHGHAVKMMSVQRVKAFASPHKKNDLSDAEAICTAAMQASVPSVRIKGTNQQDLDLLFNYREQLVKQRVALINQAHAIGLEYGVALPTSKSPKLLEEILVELENASNELSAVAREMIFTLLAEAKSIDEKTDRLEKRFSSLMQGNKNFELLKSIPGVGVLTAVAVLANTGGDLSQFKNGRQFAAYLGLVPRQYSTGGKTKLLGITKSGPTLLRRLLVVGSSSTMRIASRKTDRMHRWIVEKISTMGYRKASVAVANKKARIIYAVLTKQEPYKAMA